MTTPATPGQTPAAGTPPAAGAPPASGAPAAGAPPATPPAPPPPAAAGAQGGAPAASADTILDPTPTTDTGQKGADGADGAAPKGAEEGKGKQPESDFDIKLPDGVKADEVFLTEFKPLAKELGLKGEGAQKLVDSFIKWQGEAAKKHQEAAEAIYREWSEKAKADKEYGGAKYAENVKAAQVAYQKFSTPELRDLLKRTSLASHPEVVRLFHRLARADAEDTGGVSGGPPGRGDEDLPTVLARTIYAQKPNGRGPG